ncbi:hypothetical protein AKO1_007278 [Acrasis kona]|uniref:Uncharacterized protein n=1 Tax=Acrasis kona TaxID=1008807 RepID=A0AAW2YTZ0_9EUKA
MTTEQLIKLAIDVLLSPDDPNEIQNNPTNHQYQPTNPISSIPTRYEPSIYIRDRYSLNPVPDNLNVTLRKR